MTIADDLLERQTANREMFLVVLPCVLANTRSTGSEVFSGWNVVFSFGTAELETFMIKSLVVTYTARKAVFFFFVFKSLPWFGKADRLKLHNLYLARAILLFLKTDRDNQRDFDQSLTSKTTNSKLVRQCVGVEV